MFAPAHPADTARFAQKRGMCWNKPAAPEERFVAPGSQRDSQYETCRARSTSCAAKNRLMMPRLLPRSDGRRPAE